MAELVVKLPQKEYQTFRRKVAILNSKGIKLDYSVAHAKKRVVKLTMHKEYDWNMLDKLCEVI